MKQCAKAIEKTAIGFGHLTERREGKRKKHVGSCSLHLSRVKGHEGSRRYKH
jgi:hypothetical protein